LRAGTLSGVSAPNYVPSKPGLDKYYDSPPRRGDSWRAERPGDLRNGHPEGAGLGHQGPDQGYALKLVGRFADRVHLADGERWEDAAAGCVLVALKRASLFGRAPVIHDLDIAFRVWGFLDEGPPAELVEVRRGAFERVDNHVHHYLEGRRIADAVYDGVLRQTPAQVELAHATDWSVLVDVEIFGDAHDHEDG
jgi:hypothetical protein